MTTMREKTLWWAMRTVGIAVLLVVTWQMLQLLAFRPTRFMSLGLWQEVGMRLSVWAPCLAGGVLLTCGHASGLRLLRVAACLLVATSVCLFSLAYFRLLPLALLPVITGWSVTLVCLALASLLCRRFLPADKEMPLRYTVLAILLLGTVSAASYYSRHVAEVEANGLIHIGNVAFEAKQYEDALESWQVVRSSYAFTTSWGAASFNSGLCLRKQERYVDAIAAFTSILRSDVNDFDASPYLMEAYRNYRHRACLELSKCHEELEDFVEALRFAEMAESTYPYQSWCLTCKWGAGEQLRRRIEELEVKAAAAR